MQFTPTTLQGGEFETAVLFASYEERCLTIGETLAASGFNGNVIILYCEDIESQATQKHLDRLTALHRNRCQVWPVSYRAATQVIVKTKPLEAVHSLLVDATAFTRENLFAFLWARRFGIECFPSIVFGYTAPNEYGAWLSSGYGRAHNILGFGGTTEWASKRHLICCVGYESERALAVIEALEPSDVTLAFGSVPTRDEFLSRNKDAVTEVLGNSNFYVREINVRDPSKCLSDLQAIKNDVGEGVSIHVAPFNTKVSCLAIFGLWLQDRSIRVWNSLPETYNVHGYSEGHLSPQYFKVEW